MENVIFLKDFFVVVFLTYRNTPHNLNGYAQIHYLHTILYILSYLAKKSLFANLVL